MTHHEPVCVFPPAREDGLLPHALLAELRRDAPVARVQLPYGGEAWLVTRYHDAKLVMCDPRFSRAAAVGAQTPRLMEQPGGAGSIVMMDPPEHTRLRRSMSSFFGPRGVARLRRRVTRIAELLWEDMEALARPVDLVEHFAVPLPVAVICELMGVPFADRPRFQRWSTILMSTGAYRAEQVREAQEQLADYLVGLIEEHRGDDSADDVIGALVRAQPDGTPFTDVEILTTIGTLLIAGHETTSSQLANFAYVLLSEPSQLQRLRREPALLPNAIEELSRYVALGSGASFARIATQELMISGTRIRAGEAVLVSLPAANHDPEIFTHPETVELTRSEAPHLAYGYGPHHCLGANLARLELTVAMELLFLQPARVITLGVPVQELTWKRGVLIRGPQALPVRW